MIRIIAGSLKGRKVKTPIGLTTRPTLEKTRGVIFNVLQSRYDLSDYEAYDLFAGTGALGFEALSRGATSVTFVERDKNTFRCLKETIGEFGVESVAKAVMKDTENWLAMQNWGSEKALILLDPPYESGLLEKVLAILAEKATVLSGSLIVLETARKHTLNIPEAFHLFQTKTLSKTRLDFIEIL